MPPQLSVFKEQSVYCTDFIGKVCHTVAEGNDIFFVWDCNVKSLEIAGFDEFNHLVVVHLVEAIVIFAQHKVNISGVAVPQRIADKSVHHLYRLQITAKEDECFRRSLKLAEQIQQIFLIYRSIKIEIEQELEVASRNRS